MPQSPLPHLVGFGPLGVRVFFVISGMLITRLLLEERQHTGGVSLKEFYARRTLRILPAMWVYVAVIAALALTGIIAVPRRDFVHALTYTTNYISAERSWYLGHIWSLSVEEQFYILWPLALSWRGPRAAKHLALGAIAIAPLLRGIALLTIPGADTGNTEWFPTACDALAIGCLLALLPDAARRRLTFRWITSRWFFVVPVLVAALNVLIRGSHNRVLALVLGSLGVTAMNAGIALIVERVVSFPDDGFGRILNSGPVVWLGRISYSLYLWQMPFLNHQDSSWITRLPVNLIGAMALACLSYYAIETPIGSIRKRFRWNRAQEQSVAEEALVREV